ncbi:hypothetical protein [Nostoc sp.]
MNRGNAALHKCGMNLRLKPLKIPDKLGEIIHDLATPGNATQA